MASYENILKAIRARCVADNGVSGLYTLLGGRFYLDVAPNETESPYGVFSVVSSVPVHDTGGNREELLIQITVVSSTGATQACALFDAVKTLYDRCELTITGWSAIRMLRTGQDGPTKVDTDWYMSADYSVWARPT